MVPNPYGPEYSPEESAAPRIAAGETPPRSRWGGRGREERARRLDHVDDSEPALLEDGEPFAPLPSAAAVCLLVVVEVEVEAQSVQGGRLREQPSDVHLYCVAPGEHTRLRRKAACGVPVEFRCGATFFLGRLWEDRHIPELFSWSHVRSSNDEESDIAVLGMNFFWGAFVKFTAPYHDSSSVPSIQFAAQRGAIGDQKIHGPWDFMFAQ